ncbi:hypothetical protein B0T26DRAFT_740038 [Lasiosphaeria miniovina]|uniref:Aminoglycoside phosphotransferase domain-containing protein n=1 Tax=Lasiosphaeria miniovina TaxID=1954250 RepID=A0AA40AVV4_9PEZI|nr:uncharacterized protein B0T26DRAFT_740038 [Lasiosphaeria miniovina]KAK0722970.1 hypothetical protein B0T26DRAFT_740038 [Lasiosphaeria miniovina]
MPTADSTSSSRAVAYFGRTRRDQLCLIAPGVNSHRLSCVALDQVTSGMKNVEARVRIKTSLQGGGTAGRLEAEVATIQFINENSDLPVPRVFAHALDDDDDDDDDDDNNNPPAAAYMPIEVLPDIVAMDALDGYDVHRGVIPAEYRPSFYRSVAACHVQIASLRMPKTGTSSPLPENIGGPFDTAAAFFEAWTDTVRFKWDRETIGRMTQQRSPIPAERMVTIVEQFPSRIKAMASRLSASHTHTNDGPFPLCHDDFTVTGIIDWEGACTVPWELGAFPEFLQAMPASFDLPHRYDALAEDGGQPLDGQVRQMWRERCEYVDIVRAAEDKDSLLSKCLASARSQALAYAYGAFASTGKLGFYDRLMDEVERRDVQ